MSLDCSCGFRDQYHASWCERRTDDIARKLRRTIVDVEAITPIEFRFPLNGTYRWVADFVSGSYGDFRSEREAREDAVEALRKLRDRIDLTLAAIDGRDR